MALTLNAGRTDTCAYCMCTAEGHGACLVVADHYARLVTAAAALASAHPDDPLAHALTLIMTEQTPAQQTA